MKVSKLLLPALATGTAAYGYARYIRPHVLDWGATPEENARAMPGDEILPDVALETTRAISIVAPQDCVWPWLAQMGPRPRGGAYTYDWIENLFGLDIHSVDRVLPQFQHLEVGDVLGEGNLALTVRLVEPGWYLVLEWPGAVTTWSFGLYPQEGGITRLVSRNRMRSSGLLSRLILAVFMEPGSLVMERKMLLGIKQRAERLHASNRTRVPAGSAR